MLRVLVTGASGFIGHHLVSLLRSEGYWVRGVDVNPPLKKWGGSLKRPSRTASSAHIHGYSNRSDSLHVNSALSRTFPSFNVGGNL
jgi:nucleoside-diphosphate-sugar epimerase